MCHLAGGTSSTNISGEAPHRAGTESHVQTCAAEMNSDDGGSWLVGVRIKVRMAQDDDDHHADDHDDDCDATMMMTMMMTMMIDDDARDLDDG